VFGRFYGRPIAYSKWNIGHFHKSFREKKSSQLE
jgi:hypothetical protein